MHHDTSNENDDSFGIDRCTPCLEFQHRSRKFTQIEIDFVNEATRETLAVTKALTVRINGLENPAESNFSGASGACDANPKSSLLKFI
jgi:hypothetical protein